MERQVGQSPSLLAVRLEDPGLDALLDLGKARVVNGHQLRAVSDPIDLPTD